VQAASEGIKVAFEVQKGAIILLQKALRIRGVQLGVSYFSHQENADFMRDAMVFLNPSLPPVISMFQFQFAGAFGRLFCL
jgi:hypothetical protein